MAKRSAVLLLALAGITNGIYPDDHWDYSKELTEDNFDQYVLDEIEADRTLFAPAWDAVTRAFNENNDVSFGDINLSEQKIRGNHNPGSGGWPTIRYFNKETGAEGASYVKKTDKAMCDELGAEEYMSAYVEEAGATSLCALDGNGCDERQIKYIEKMRAKGLDQQQKQYERLNGMKDKDMAEDLRAWKNKRKKILSQFIKEQGQKEEL